MRCIENEYEKMWSKVSVGIEAGLLNCGATMSGLYLPHEIMPRLFKSLCELEREL